MHPQYDLFKQWVSVKRPLFENLLEDRRILYGEWMYARHNVHYRALPHYFLAFDIFDKERGCFLDLKTRLQILEGSGLQSVPVLHRGPAGEDKLRELIGPSDFAATFENPVFGQPDHLMEGLYLRTEADGVVTGRAKIVRPEFVEKIKRNEQWQQKRLVPNLLREGADIWA